MGEATIRCRYIPQLAPVAEEDAKSGWACCTATGTSVDSLGFCQAFCQHTQGKSSLKKVSVTSRHKRNVHVHVKMPTRQHGKTLDHRSRGDTHNERGGRSFKSATSQGNGWLGLDLHNRTRTMITIEPCAQSGSRNVLKRHVFAVSKERPQTVSCRPSINLRSLRNGAYRLRVRRLRSNGARPRGSERARLRAAAPLCETRPRGRASKPAGTRYVTSCHLTWRETEAPQYQSLGTGAAPA